MLSGLYCLLIRESPQGNLCLLLANDESQAGNALDLAKKLVACNPVLEDELEILVREIRRRDGKGTLKILPAQDVRGAHGLSAIFVGYDEIHAYKNYNLFEALAPDPTRSNALVWITTYDSIDGEPGQPLYDYKRIGMEGSDPKMYFSWYSADLCIDPEFAQLSAEERANPSIASFVPGYLEQQQRRLPSHKYKRLHLNLPVRSESAFIDNDDWTALIDPSWIPPHEDPKLTVWVGLDIGIKNDATAITAVTYDRDAKKVKLVYSDTWAPLNGQPVPINSLVPYQIGQLRKRFQVRQILFDPFQCVAIAQRLTAQGAPMEELPQTPANLTEITTNLYNLIKHRNLVIYPGAEELRIAMTRAAAAESGRGWKLTKNSHGDRIDAAVALAMACLAASTQGEIIESSETKFPSAIVAVRNKDTGETAVYGAPKRNSPPLHYTKAGQLQQQPEPWRAWVTAFEMPY